MLKVLGILTLTVAFGGGAAMWRLAPSIAAGGLLYPARHDALPERPANCTDVSYRGAGVTLRGWSCRAAQGRRGTVVYLHGIADNRGSAVGAIQRYTARGFDVVAYDGRAHGASTGDVCTYGFHEKADLRAVLDTLPRGPLVLIGTSLGAAVALQAAADEPRIAGVVAAEVFADLETVARDRAPAFLTDGIIRAAFTEAEARGQFRIADVSPEAVARRVRVPVLLIHGADDVETAPRHSQRVFDALAGPKRLILVPGAGHNQSLHRQDTWREVDQWIDAIVNGGTS